MATEEISSTDSFLAPILDIEQELQVIEVKRATRSLVRAAEAKAEAERQSKKQEQIYADGLADYRKREAVEAERSKRRAAERKLAETAAAAERASIRAACTLVYDSTANKRVVDVTVKESQQIKACQVMNLYPPH